jgi:hypothetical protein
MLIKSADDKNKDIETLQGLLNNPSTPTVTRKEIEQEIRNIRSGQKGEKDAAYEIEFYFGRSKNWAVVHDLRIAHGGWVAQIDHILVNRWLNVWVCESKRFGEGIAINEYGECSAFFDGKPYEGSSPFEQNRKHCAVLKAAFDDGAVEMTKHLGFFIKPDIRSLILVSKNARITRPEAKSEEADAILRADQIKSRIDKDLDSRTSNQLSGAKIIASDTLEDFAKRLASLHTPIAFDWHATFGLSKESVASASETQSEGVKKSKPVCSSCGTTVTHNVAEFCGSKKATFGGKVYCINCQKNVPTTVAP